MTQRICWQCETKASMTPNGDPIRTEDGRAWTRAYRCDNCGYQSIGVLHNFKIETSYYHPTEGFDDFYADIEWLPPRILGRRFDDVPDEIADAASEAYACYSIRSYRAATLLARGVTEAICKDQGITNGNLKAKIDELEKQRKISPLTADTAHEIRFVGNDMAHGDFVSGIGEEECDDLLNFMSSLLEEVYQRPANLTRFREQRQRRTAQDKNGQP